MDPLIFKILPPPVTWESEKIESWCADACKLLRKSNFLSVTIPEVAEEMRQGIRPVPFIQKIDNVYFSQLLKNRIKNIVAIPNKICVRLTKRAFADWVEQIYQMGARHLVLVGGEHEDGPCPGYSLLESVSFVKKHYSDIQVGAIAIFDRKGEALRLLAKRQAGIDFFISQIIYEATSLKQVMSQLSAVCLEKNLSMPRIYLSLALACENRDVEFMRWLGVVFPPATLSYLIGGEEAGLQARSQRVVNELLDEIFHFMKNEKIDFGFSVEHVLYKNLHLSQMLSDEIKNRLIS